MITRQETAIQQLKTYIEDRKKSLARWEKSQAERRKQCNIEMACYCDGWIDSITEEIDRLQFIIEGL